jgi:hypothetical protein
MPITFNVNARDGYFLATWQGQISSDEILDSYRTFLE